MMFDKEIRLKEYKEQAEERKNDQDYFNTFPLAKYSTSQLKAELRRRKEDKR